MDQKLQLNLCTNESAPKKMAKFRSYLPSLANFKKSPSKTLKPDELNGKLEVSGTHKKGLK
jgi:hypothetical protein